MPKLYGQAAYQGQQDDDDPMSKAKLKNREEKQWRSDWEREQFSIRADEQQLEYYGQSTSEWNAMVRRILPERMHHRYLIPDDVEVAKKPTFEGRVIVAFSPEQRMYVATTPEYPELSCADETAEDAASGLRDVTYRYCLSKDDGVPSAVSEGWL
jgi:hypothetical protein